MGQLLQIVTPLHTRTRRDHLARMLDDKPECMRTASRYGREYWDGDRRFGYGGYRYDGRWEPVARALVERFGLGPGASILDVGCGKGYLLYEFTRLLPGCRIAGLDISGYAIENAKEEVRDRLMVHRAEAPYPFADNEFDLVVSLTTLHNLYLFDLECALQEVERVGRHGYVVVESYRSEEELCALQCWALTCRSFFSTAEWIWLFDRLGYSGDYEFIFF